MRTFTWMCLAVAMAAGAAQAQEAPEATGMPEMPPMPEPQQEHEWLEQFVGEWTFETQVFMEPDQPPMTATGTETVRRIGGFWIIAESVSDMMGMPFTNVLTFGFDPETQKYIGTSVDSMSSHLWTYEGEVDDSGRIFTMQWEGPCHRTPGGLAQFRGSTEFRSPDHRVFTAMVQDEQGGWTPAVTVDFQRKD